MKFQISNSVGLGCINNTKDVKTVQEMLNYIGEHLKNNNQPYFIRFDPIPISGVVFGQTQAVLQTFLRYIAKVQPDTMISPGPTFDVLNRAAQLSVQKVGGWESGASNRIARPSSGSFQLPQPTPGGYLSETDFIQAAKDLNCEVAAIKAVAETETRQKPFFPSGRPAILFERHQFSKYSKRKFDRSNPNIANVHKGGYLGGEKEYDRLLEAMNLDCQAALKSASWGRFQVMGFNHEICGYKDVQDFVIAMFKSEQNHLKAFVNFVKANNLTKALQQRNWTTFANVYNGPEQKGYDKKMLENYQKFKK